MDTDLADKLSAQTLEQGWQMAQRRVGAHRPVSAVHEEPSETNDVVFVAGEFEKMKLDTRTPVGKDGKIGGLNFSRQADCEAQDYATAAAFREQEVAVGSGERSAARSRPWA